MMYLVSIARVDRLAIWLLYVSGWKICMNDCYDYFIYSFILFKPLFIHNNA